MTVPTPRSRRRLAVAAALAAVLGSLFAARAWRRFGEPGGTANATSLCAHAARIFCQKLAACGGLAEAQRPLCVDRHARECDDDLGFRLRRGILALDGEAQEECEEGLEAASCGAVLSVLGDDDQEILELTDRCEEEELQPRSGFGDPCVLPGDCKQGSCPYAEAGCHSCRPFAPLGAACALGGDACDKAVAYCDRGEAGGRCAPLKPTGARCLFAEECATNLCRSVAAGARACATPGQATSCLDSRDCDAAFVCRRSETGGRCEPRVKTGRACEDDPHDNVCAEPEARCVGGRCRVRPFSEQEGAACRELSDCQSGLYCQSQAAGAGRCARQAGAGGACRVQDYGACGLGARCIEGTCRRLGAIGESCGGPYLCLAELECIPDDDKAGFKSGAHCREPVEDGAACAPYRSCRTGYCRSEGGRGVCIPKARAGAPCRSREECASGRCQAVPGASGMQCQGPCG